MRAGASRTGAFNVTGGTGTMVKLAQWGMPFIHVSSGTIGNNGALSAITSLSITYSNGAYVYYPANSIAAGVAAGWYWTVFTSGTAGTIFNNTYTSGQPLAPAATTPFVTTGPGAFTGDTAEQAGPTITIPANALGANGTIFAQCQFSNNNTAGNKVTRIRYTASGIATGAYGSNTNTTATGGIMRVKAQNRGVTNSQFGWQEVILAASIVGGFPGATTVDTTAASVVTLTATKAVATDNAVIEQGEVFFCA